MDIAILAIILAIVGVLAGWLVPLAFGGRRPYGLATDISACVLVMLVLGLVEYIWIMPLFNFAGWVDWLASIGDPLAVALIVLWVMRKMSPEVPQDEAAEAEALDTQQAG
jgi:hypothetical protein